MRTFAIADASKRKALPVALLLWREDEASDQGRFLLTLSEEPEADDLPLSLAFCAQREHRCATGAESEAWVRSRIVPDDRHNIVEVLQANGLATYDEVSLLAASGGLSSDDDYRAYEVQLPKELERALADALEAGAPPPTDRVLKTLRKRRAGAQVSYACIDIPEEAVACPPRSPQRPTSAAARIGRDIRAHRKAAGLTQKQLAARAGITQTVLSRVESGAGNPTLALLGDIASALDVQLDVSLGNHE